LFLHPIPLPIRTVQHDGAWSHAMPGQVSHSKWMRRGLKRLLVRLPPARRYFARKDKIAADLERFVAELSIRTAERDEALEKIKQLGAERDACLQMVRHLSLTAAAFLVQRDAAFERARSGIDRTDDGQNIRGEVDGMADRTTTPRI
jgi:hypothetical protein